MKAEYEECCYPRCHAGATEKLYLPLCDRHMVKTYRAVAELMSNPAYQLRAVDAMIEERVEGRVDQGVVYFIQFSDRVKIGFTTQLRKRLSQLPYDRLVAAIEGSLSTEKALHRKFATHHVRNEWFQADSEILEFATNHPHRVA